MEKPPDELLKRRLDAGFGRRAGPGDRLRGAAGKLELSGGPQEPEIPRLREPEGVVAVDADWKLPPDWREILRAGFKERLAKYRSLRLFLDICVRCGACADKCHFFIGSGDPKNMPVARAELLRSVYRNDFTVAGRLLGGARRCARADARDSEGVVLLLLPVHRVPPLFGVLPLRHRYRRDHDARARAAESLVGLNINWVMEPAANCHRTGNHLGIQPHTFKDNIEFLCDELADATGIRVTPSINRRGAEILFVVPSADYFADPGIYTFMGYLLLFEHIGLDYTLSAYASEGGNFGLFTSHDMMKRLNYKIYAEAKRLGVKWILGGECGHMWRVVHQYMDTMNGPADFLEQPVSPITGTRFTNAASTRMVHICEFTSDLIHEGRLRLDPSRNDHLRVTFHDSCNPSRAMGLLEEPRYVINSVCNHFFEMPENTIREQTFCCGGGAGLGNDENMEMRLRGGMPRGAAVAHVRDRHGVNQLACVCAIDRATLPALVEYLGARRRGHRRARNGRQRARDGRRDAARQGPAGPSARRGDRGFDTGGRAGLP